jgi:hypothetical protein
MPKKFKKDVELNRKLGTLIASLAMQEVARQFAAIRLRELEAIIAAYRSLRDAAFDKWLADRRRAYRKLPKPQIKRI